MSKANLPTMPGYNPLGIEKRDPVKIAEDIRKFEEMIGMSFDEFAALPIEEQLAVALPHFTRIPAPSQQN